MLDYQCVTEKAVASSRKADTRNFVCGRGSSHLRQSLAEPNDSLLLSIIMTCTLTNINNFSGKHGGFPEKSGNSRHCQCSYNGLIPICRKCT